MATGSGKTFTAISSIYRLIKYGGARRVLFLVDRGNLGRQAEKEFQQLRHPGRWPEVYELYNVQRLPSNRMDPVAKVCGEALDLSLDPVGHINCGIIGDVTVRPGGVLSLRRSCRVEQARLSG